MAPVRRGWEAGGFGDTSATMQTTTMQPRKATRTAQTENFPVAAWFLAPQARAQVLAFYRLARAGDDCADDHTIPPSQRLVALADLQQGPAATLLRQLCPDPIAQQAIEQLFSSFEQDVRRDLSQTVVSEWPELVALCELSAVPVGRFLLAVHGQAGAAVQTASDALCIALQVLNHVQDCGDDWRAGGRIFIPGAQPSHLAAPSCPQPLRAALDGALDQVDALLVTAAPLPAQITNHRLRVQAAMTLALARALAVHLRRADPLRGQGPLPRWRLLAAVLTGLVHGVTR
jgi:hydroxysqualene synthase